MEAVFEIKLRQLIDGIEDERIISIAYTREAEKKGYEHATWAMDGNGARERLLAMAQTPLDILKSKQIKKEDLRNFLNAHGENVKRDKSKIELLWIFLKKLDEWTNSSQTASAEGSGEATSVEGADEATAAEGSGEATSVEGADEATAAEGTGEATSVNGVDGATAAEGISDAASTEASGEATAAVDALQTLQIGRD